MNTEGQRVDKDAWFWRVSNRPDFPAWRAIFALALALALALAFKLVSHTLPRVVDSLGVLEEKWPGVVVQGSHFQLADSSQQMFSLDLPVGWRLILDPAERLTLDDLSPYTVVVQQGRFLVVRKPGQRLEPSWGFSDARQTRLDRTAFRKLRLLVWAGLALLVLAGFLGSLLGLVAAATVASGLLLLAEFLGILHAPRSPFAFSVLALVPFVALLALTWAVAGFGLSGLALWLAFYLILVLTSCAFLGRRERERT